MAVDRQVFFMELDLVSLFWLCVSGFQFREHRACFKPRPAVYLLPPVPKENPRHDFKKSEKVLQACLKRRAGNWDAPCGAAAVDCPGSAVRRGGPIYSAIRSRATVTDGAPRAAACCGGQGAEECSHGLQPVTVTLTG